MSCKQVKHGGRYTTENSCIHASPEFTEGATLVTTETLEFESETTTIYKILTQSLISQACGVENILGSHVRLLVGALYLMRVYMKVPSS